MSCCLYVNCYDHILFVLAQGRSLAGDEAPTATSRCYRTAPYAHACVYENICYTQDMWYFLDADALTGNRTPDPIHYAVTDFETGLLHPAKIPVPEPGSSKFPFNYGVCLFE